jgi:hypothetical protein
MKRMFAFDPARYASAYAAEGFVHVPNGVTPEFLATLTGQVEESLQNARLKQFAIGDKQQALYQFPEGGDYYGELLRAVSGVCGLDVDKLVLSERHFKAYDASAAPYPLPHKDRFASEVSVGLSVRVTEGSTLVLYPRDQVGVNPFNSSGEMRHSLGGEDLPENVIPADRQVHIHDTPGDVILFRGSAFWHMRYRPAGTVMLYLKLNSFHCDPLGEDPRTPQFREQTRGLLTGSDAELEAMLPLLGRRVDYIHRRHDRHWGEVLGVVLWGEKHLTIDDSELRALQAMDGQRTLGQVVEAMGGAEERAVRLARLRRLATLGIVDLCPPARVPGSWDPVAALSADPLAVPTVAR